VSDGAGAIAYDKLPLLAEAGYKNVMALTARMTG
jgi:hypothetical protein